MASTRRDQVTVTVTPHSVSSWTKRHRVNAKYNAYLKEAYAEELVLNNATNSDVASAG